MTAEQWRPIADWPDYEVSDHGRVVSLKSGARRELVGQQSAGYRQVLLNDHGRRRMAKVHVLVAETFIRPRQPGEVVRHYDGDSLHNHVSNLRVGTQKENVQDTLRHGRHPQASKTHCAASHEFTEDNTWHTKTGRKCKTCDRERQQAARDLRAFRAANVPLAS